MTGIKKPENWETSLKDCINEGLNFKETNERLIGGLGKEGSVSKAAYQSHKKDLTGGPETDKALSLLGERMKDQKPQGPARPKWTPQKQKAADTSKLAELFNKGIYNGVMPFCKTKDLKESDVQDINLGGAIVGTIQWAVPGANLDHPLIVLATRGIMFYLTFKRICTQVQERVDGIRAKMAGAVESSGSEQLSGIKPEFQGKAK